MYCYEDNNTSYMIRGVIMEKKFILFSCILLILPITVNATGGGLRKASIKTCPNGVTYGMHSDGHGGTHWHVAVTNGNNYYADGEAIYSDPCPGYNKNEGTAGATDGNNNSSSNSSVGNNNVNNNSNNSGQANYTKEVEKSKDNSIKKVVIDDEEITVSDKMNFKTENKQVSIKIEANDSKAKIDYENNELTLGENIINIVVTAENGDQKNYILTINKIKGQGTATIKKFILGAGEVEFENNKATIKKLKNETSLEYSYELSDMNAKLIVYLNGTETKELKSLKENDKIKLVVVDENDNENVYEITVTNTSIIYSFIVYGLTALIMLFLIVGVIIAVIVIKKKKKSLVNLKN